PGARSEYKVAGPVITDRKPHPLAGDPEVTLRSAGGIGGAEPAGIDLRPLCKVVRDGIPFDRFGDIPAGVLQQGHEVVGRVADRGALEIDHADAAEAGPVRQPEQIAGEEVAMDEAPRA